MTLDCLLGAFLVKPLYICAADVILNLSSNITGKEFILDINIMLNDDTLINLEMQVASEYNWSERSLSYLCRAYDQLHRGKNMRKCFLSFILVFLILHFIHHIQNFTPLIKC